MPRKMALVASYHRCHPEQCDGGVCAAARACTRRLLTQEAPNDAPITDTTACRACGDCVRACPSKAIEIVVQ